MNLQACHQLYFPTVESLYQYLCGGRHQVQDLRDPHKAYRLVVAYSKPLFKVRDLRDPRVQWRFCRFEMPVDLRFLQPLGDAPEDQLYGLL